jgi:hypothetical protein
VMTLTVFSRLFAHVSKLEILNLKKYPPYIEKKICKTLLLICRFLKSTSNNVLQIKKVQNLTDKNVIISTANQNPGITFMPKIMF